MSSLSSTFLPPDCLSVVFSFLEPVDLGKLAPINREWNNSVNDPSLCPSFWLKAWPKQQVPKNIKKEITKIAVFSEDALIKRIKTFAENISLQSRNSFMCLFPLQPTNFVTIQLTPDTTQELEEEKTDSSVHNCLFLRIFVSSVKNSHKGGLQFTEDLAVSSTKLTQKSVSNTTQKTLCLCIQRLQKLSEELYCLPKKLFKIFYLHQ